MSVSEIPAAERARRAPPLDIPVRTWWAGVHAHVFVAPNPFYRLPLPGAEGEGAEAFDPCGHPSAIPAISFHLLHLCRLSLHIGIFGYLLFEFFFLFSFLGSNFCSSIISARPPHTAVRSVAD